MDRRHLTPRFQLQEASDTEMTPPCPTYERTNPFDDLAPSNTPVSPTFEMSIEPGEYEPNSLGMRRKNIQGGMGISEAAQERGRESITVSRRSSESRSRLIIPFQLLF
jgi:hypothetical protein